MPAPETGRQHLVAELAPARTSRRQAPDPWPLLVGPPPSRRAPKRRWRLPGAVLLVAVLVAFAAFAAASQPRPGPIRYSLVQVFDGPAGSSPNYGLKRPLWFSDPCWSSGCGSPAVPTRFRSANAYQDGHGHLVLVARRGASGRCGPLACRYTSARLTMIDWAPPFDGRPSFSQRYGTFSARLRVPSGRGFWPAFWLVGADIAKVGWPNSGEIDALESFGGSSHVQQHVEFGTGRDVVRFGGAWALPSGESVAGWHTYTVVWSPQGITWQVDGTTTLSLNASQVGPDWRLDFEHPFTLILDLAVGGVAGLPGKKAHFPAKMLVAWVKVSKSY